MWDVHVVDRLLDKSYRSHDRPHMNEAGFLVLTDPDDATTYLNAKNFTQVIVCRRPTPESPSGSSKADRPSNYPTGSRGSALVATPSDLLRAANS